MERNSRITWQGERERDNFLVGNGRSSASTLAGFILLLVGVLACASRLPAQETPARLRPDDGSGVRVLREQLLDATVHGVHQAERDRLLKRVLVYETDSGERVAQIEAQLSQLLSDRDNQNGSVAERNKSIQDLRRQRSLLWLARLEVAVLRCELLPVGSVDRIDAATEAVAIARSAIAALPPTGVVRREALRLLAESYLLSGDAEAAAKTIRQINRTKEAEQTVEPDKQRLSTDPPLVDPTASIVEALTTRVLLQRRQLELAEDRLRRFYGDAPAEAPLNDAMDMAFLQWLLTDDANQDRIASWIDLMERRGGSASRRLAERTVSEFVERNAIELESPRLAIGRAQLLLRRGEAIPAAVLLARTAMTDRDGTRATQSAIQSAAILNAEGKPDAASELLMQVASRHPSASQAPDLCLQAALLIQQTIADTRPVETETMPTVEDVLRGLMESWPESTAADQARDWRMELAKQSGDWESVVQLSTWLPKGRWNDERELRAVHAWIQLREQRGGDLEWERVQEVFAEAEDCVALRVVKRLTQLLLAPRVVMVATNDSADARLRNALPSWAEDFGEFRVANQANESLALPDQEWLREAAIERLEQDVLEDPARQSMTARALLTQPTDASGQRRMRWLFWAGRLDEGIDQLRQLQRDGDPGGAWLKRAAETLRKSQAEGGRAMAVSLYEELAQGLPIGTLDWHEARLRSLEARREIQDAETARRTARLILLTQPPEDAGQVQRYEQLAEMP
ncbi:MAG: hypothetical protein AAGD07_09630 [Planctomycetota bacterium]